MPRRSSAAAALHAALTDTLPELWYEGSWLVLSNRLPLSGRAPTYLHVLIDVRAGTCLASAIDDAPLGTRVGNWLEAAVKEGHRPLRVFTDNIRDINFGTLVSWGASRGVSPLYHPGSSAPASVCMLMQSLADAISGMSNQLGKDADLTLARGLDNWRLHYNNALVFQAAATPGNHSRGR